MSVSYRFLLAGLLVATLHSGARVVQARGNASPSTPPSNFIRGDADADGRVTVSDGLRILHHLCFRSRHGTTPCLKALDVTDNGKVHFSDAIRLFRTLFCHRHRIPAPYPDCGVDPTADRLSCESFPVCAVVEQPGCTDPDASNYDPDANVDDGSCEYYPEIPGFTLDSENAQGLPEYTHDSSGIEFVLLPGGEFEMGSPDTEEGRFGNEGPVHTVTLSPFLIAKTGVTQAEYAEVMAGNTAGLNATPSTNYGSAPPDSQRPVETVSWNDLKAADGFLARTGLSLPSEAQWEYACRAGQAGPYSGTGVLDDMGWYSGNAGGSHHPVGEKLANQFGLHDMHGNVWEWCEDVYDPGFYATPEASGPDPEATTSGSEFRVIRGGSFLSDALLARSAFRYDFPSSRFFLIGFRPAWPLP